MELPTWEECDAATASLTATPLQQFIYDNEPAGPHDEVFRDQLSVILAAARQEAFALGVGMSADTLALWLHDSSLDKDEIDELVPHMQARIRALRMPEGGEG